MILDQVSNILPNPVSMMQPQSKRASFMNFPKVNLPMRYLANFPKAFP